MTSDDRTLLKECKVVIKELNEELTNSLQTIQNLEEQISDLKLKQQGLQKQLSQKNQINQRFKKQLSELQSVSEKNNYIVEQYETRIKCKQKDIRILEEELEFLHKQMKKDKDEGQIYKKVFQQSKQKNLLMQETIQLLLEENKQLKNERQMKSLETKWEIEELKLLNQDIKKRFKQEFYQEDKLILPTQSSPNPEKTPSPLRPTRHISTEKPSRSSSNKKNNIQNLTPIHSYINQRKIEPEVSHHIQSIKKEIASQYTMLRVKKEGYSKDRVNKTLEELKRKVNKIVQHAQQSDTSSIFD